MQHASSIRSLALMAWLLASAPAVLAESPLFGERAPDAPVGVAQYGQFVGSWTCVPASRQEDGSLKESDARPTWVWHYALNGHAVQDVWIPDLENSPPGAAMGTNLRVYDPEKDEWIMVWTTETLRKFQTFRATMQDGDIVMRGDIEAGPHQAHLARITFYNISNDHFDWKYEASAPQDGQNWQLHSTLACDRMEK